MSLLHDKPLCPAQLFEECQRGQPGYKAYGEQSKMPGQKQFSNFYFKSFIYLRHYSFCVTLETPFKSLYSSGTDTLGFKHFTMLDS